MEIPEVILSNIFVCKYFPYGFVNELLIKNMTNYEVHSLVEPQR